MDVDEATIQACRRGDPQAFETLVRLTHRDVYSLAYRLTGNAEDAADVSQEVYYKLLRVIRSFRGEAKFSTWLYRVTSNVAISYLRKRARRGPEVPLSEDSWGELPSTGAHPDEEAERAELRGILDDALRRLPVGYRAVVVLKEVYGFPLAEIGSQLGITEGAAKVRLFRARRRLKGMLADSVGEDRSRGPTGPRGKDSRDEVS